MLPALRDRKMQAGTVVLGDVTVQGNVKGVPSLAEPVQVSLDNGALRVLVPLANKAQIAGLSEDAVEKLDLVFYGDVDRAVGKAVVG
jgi:ATP-dependent Lon protease